MHDSIWRRQLQSTSQSHGMREENTYVDKPCVSSSSFHLSPFHPPKKLSCCSGSGLREECGISYKGTGRTSCDDLVFEEWGLHEVTDDVELPIVNCVDVGGSTGRPSQGQKLKFMILNAQPSQK